VKKSKIFLICCISFIIGIVVASFVQIKFIENDLLWFVEIVVLIVLTILFWSNKKIRLIALIGLFLFLAIWRYSISLPQNIPNKIWYYNNQVLEITGAIGNEPDIRAQNQKLELNVEEIAISKEFKQNRIPVTGKILITAKLYPVYNYGDKLKIVCELLLPTMFNGFAYDRYLARYDIFSVCYYPKIEYLDSGNGNKIYSYIFNFKNKLRAYIDYGLIEPEASLARAIILGDKKSIPQDLRDKFSQAGISHIVAISGMHISILSAIVMGMLLGAGLARKYAFYIATIFLLTYIALIGLPASAMRAGIMGFLVLWALKLGRLNKITNSLVLSAVILLLINPKLLRDDIGFQLSFLAVLGIISFYPIFEKFSNKLLEILPKNKLYLKFLNPIFSIFNITTAAQIFLLPIIALNFSQVSIIAPISNLLILWVLPILMFAIIIAIILSALFPYFSLLFFAPAFFLLKYIIITTELLVEVPYSYAKVYYIWFGWIIIYYIVVILSWVLYRKYEKQKAN